MEKTAGTLICTTEDITPLLMILLKNDYQVLIDPIGYGQVKIEYCYVTDTGLTSQANFIAIDRQEEDLIRSFRGLKERESD